MRGGVWILRCTVTLIITYKIIIIDLVPLITYNIMIEIPDKCFFFFLVDSTMTKHQNGVYSVQNC